MSYSWILRCAALVKKDVSAESIASNIREKRISVPKTLSAVITN
jgi:hypothetical protein